MRVKMTAAIEDSHQFLGKFDDVKGHKCGGVFTRKGRAGKQDIIAHVIAIPAGVELTDADLPDLAGRDWIGVHCEVLEE